MDAAIGIDEGDIAARDGAVFIPIVTDLISRQRHSRLPHLDIAGCQHAAVILVYGYRVSFKADVLFGGHHRCDAEAGSDTQQTCDNQMSKNHRVLGSKQTY